MSENRYSITSDASHEIELLLTRFERDRESGPVDLVDYAPAENDPAYESVVTELARIDLEYRFDEENSPDAKRYVKLFPFVFSDQHHRTQLAFEEYRLRRRSGEDVSGNSIGKRYDVDGSHWPKMMLGTGRSDTGQAISRRFTEHDLIPPKVRYPSVGDTFSGYPLIARIGEGAYSRVFLARQPDLASRLVVLKVTPLSTSESDQLASLQHSAIIPVYSVHREGDLSCICMPFLGATTLTDLAQRSARWASLEGPANELISTILDQRESMIRTVVDRLDEETASRARGLPENRATEVLGTNREPEAPIGLAQYSSLGYVDALLELVIRSVEGIAYAHRHGVIHRDLKPANILVADDGNPVVLDFNLAVSSADPKTQVVGGTLPYMSPQQLEALQSRAAADMRDDVFSVGVILYELLTGRLPFACPKCGHAFDLESVIADRRNTPPSVRSLNHGVSAGLDSIIARCIAPDREQRYRDGSELLEDLKRHRQHLPLKFAPDRSIRERMTKWSARHPRLSSASSVALIATVILAVCSFLIWQRENRISRLNVESHYQRWQTQLPDAIAALSTPGREPELLANGLDKSSLLMKQWHVDSDQWKSLSDFERLDDRSRQTLSTQLGQLAYLMASAEYHVGLQSRVSDKQATIDQTRYWNRLAGKLHPPLQKLAEFQEQQISLGLDRIKPDPDRLAATDPRGNLELRAMLAAQSDDAVLWRQLTEELLDRQPTNTTHWFNLAIANGRLGDFDAAIACFDVSNRMQPRSIAILFNRGLGNLERGKNLLAQSDFSSCIRLNPGLMNPRFNRAVASFRHHDYLAALEDLDQLVKSGQTTTRVFLMRARVHEAMGHSDAVKADRNTALDIEPRDADDWVARGVWRLDDSPKLALDDFESALLVRPSDFNALNNAAYACAERLDEPMQAITMLTRLTAIRPNSAYVVATRGVLHARLGNSASALADAQRASNLSPSGREQLQIAGIHAIVSDEERRDAHREKALFWLACALRADLRLAAIARVDPDLKNLKDDPKFSMLIENARMIESEGKQIDR